MATGQRLCRFDKKITDRVAYASVRQNKREWWEGVRGNDAKLYMAVEEYKKRFPEDPNGKQRKMKASVVYTMVEQVVAISRIARETEGDMKSFKQYSAFAESIEGGKLAESVIVANWNQWKQESEATGWPPQDQDGPLGDNFRLWVKARDIIRLTDSFEKQKILEQTSKSEKGLSEADIDGKMKQLTTDHSSCAGAKLDLLKTGTQLLKAGDTTNSAYEEKQIDLADITDLAASDEEEDEDEEEVKDGEADAAIVEPVAKKARWFD